MDANPYTDAHSYIERRVDNQMIWYASKASYARRKYKLVKSIEIIGASAILAIVGHASALTETIKILIGGISFLLAITAGFSQLSKYEETWKAYRDMATALEYEKQLFLTRGYPYNADDAFSLLVQRVELMLKHNSPIPAEILLPRKDHESVDRPNNSFNRSAG